MAYARMTEYNRQQKISRLQREVSHFRAQLEKFTGDSPQDKRRHSIARRCFNDRIKQLTKLIEGK